MPTVAIGDNTGDDYAGTEDTYMYSAAATTNYGFGGQFAVGEEVAPDYRYPLISFSGISNLPSTLAVTSAIVSLWVNSTSATTDTITLKRLLRNWVFSQATYNIYSTGNNWTTAGGTSNGNDRSGTDSETITIGQTTAQYYNGNDAAQIQADVEDFADGTLSNYGWHFEKTAPSGVTFKWFASESGTDGNRPYITIVYSTGGVDYERTLSDSADASDQQQAYENKLRILLSTLDINDSIIRTLQLAGATIERTLSSNINIYDLIGSDKLFNRVLSSEIDITDFIQSFTGVVLTRILASNINLFDIISTEKEITRLISSSLVLTDAILQDRNLVRLLQDNLDLVDIIARTIVLAPQTYNRILSDNVEIQDAIIRETTGQIIQLILAKLTKAYDITMGVEVKNIKIDSEDI